MLRTCIRIEELRRMNKPFDVTFLPFDNQGETTSQLINHVYDGPGAAMPVRSTATAISSNRSRGLGRKVAPPSLC